MENSIPQAVPQHSHTDEDRTHQSDRNSAMTEIISHQPSSLHEHSDSLVTIRLSNVDAAQANRNVRSRPTSSQILSGVKDFDEDTATLADEELDDDDVVEIAEYRVQRMVSMGAASTIFDQEDSSESIAAADHSPESHDDTKDTDSMSLSSRASTISNLEDDATVMPKDLSATRSRSLSQGSSRSNGSGNVDWEKLDKNEEQEERDELTDEGTAFLLARLEQENNALAIDPKANMPAGQQRRPSRPPSFQQLKKLVQEPQKSSLRYSLLPSPPPMTELDFWTALVRSYPQTAQRLPTLTSNKIRSGVPPPLRGVVWVSIAGARDPVLEEEYEKLCTESSPYEKLITKDIGRSFPGVDMFRDPDGEGQKMLGKVLNAFSLWDQEIGYCQGLGFVVGPLLMHMNDKEAFCVLVKLMEQYDLRSCFLPTLSGLHLRIFQFQHLLLRHLPELTAHLEKLSVEPLYLSQWFLSFFGVTCPLPMLIRIYDVILTEGASETLMRVALSLMRRNEKKILAATEFEEVMQLLLSRSLWDTYGCDADDLVRDFCDWTGLVTREGLQALEQSFKHQESPTVTSKPSVHSAAARFLGRFWTGSSAATSPKSPSASSLTTPSRPGGLLKRTTSKQSMASTLNSIESVDSTHASVSTEATTMSRSLSGDWINQKPTTPTIAKPAPNKDKGLHNQIEDLLTALSDLQREHNILASELQREREARDEDRLVVSKAIEHMRSHRALDSISEKAEYAGNNDEFLGSTFEQPLYDLEEHFTSPSGRRSSLMFQTKQQLREEVARWKEQYNQETARSTDLSRRLSDSEQEVTRSKDDLREARTRIQDAYREKERLQQTNRELRSRHPTLTSLDSHNSDSASTSSTTSGLREFRLGRASTSAPKLESAQPSSQFSKRISSLSTQSLLATEDNKPANEDALLLELIQTKTSEAVARQELEEVKAKLDSLRKLVSGKSGVVSGLTPPVNDKEKEKVKDSEKEKEKAESGEKQSVSHTPSPSSGGGFFSGWGKRTISATH